MTIEELQAQLANLQAEVEKLSGEQEKEWPQDGDEYFYVTRDGDVSYSKWGKYMLEEAAAKQGIYRTREAAEMEALRRECRASRPKVYWGSMSYVYYLEGILNGMFCTFKCAYETDLQVIDSGLYGRTEEEARERWEKYGKAFEYLVDES